MINLLPPEIKKEIKREYSFRFFVIFLILVSGAVIISLITAFPYFISAKLDLATVKDENQKAVKFLEGDENMKKLSDDFAMFKQEIDLLRPAKDGDILPSTEIIDAIISDKPNNIVLSRFSFGLQPGNIEVSVDGVAGDREGLLQFTQNLSADKNFENVDLPVSNFSKKTDIEFSVSMKWSDKKKEVTNKQENVSE